MQAREKELAQDNSGNDPNLNQENMDKLNQDYEDNRDEVVKMLIANIMNVNIEIPRVVKGDFGAAMANDMDN